MDAYGLLRQGGQAQKSHKSPSVIELIANDQLLMQGSSTICKEQTLQFFLELFFLEWFFLAWFYLKGYYLV